MKTRRFSRSFAAPFCLLAAEASAHHAFSPVYDGNQTITKQGIVIEFRLVNPHSMIKLDSVDADGKPETWTLEMGGRLNLTIAGWTEDTIKPGERLTIDGNPTHTGSPRMFVRRIVKADGTELASARTEGLDAIDELRRQQALERAGQE